MHGTRSRFQATPSVLVARRMTCCMSPAVAPHTVFVPYHIESLPWCVITHGYDIVNGSSSLRSSTGTRPQRRNGSSGFDLVAIPIVFVHGTVTLRFQPM